MRYKLKREHIAAWKKREGRSNQWLAKRLGIIPNTLSDQMAGRSGLSLHMALSISKEIGVPVDKLVEAVDG